MLNNQSTVNNIYKCTINPFDIQQAANMYNSTIINSPLADMGNKTRPSADSVAQDSRLCMRQIVICND